MVTVAPVVTTGSSENFSRVCEADHEADRRAFHRGAVKAQRREYRDDPLLREDRHHADTSAQRGRLSHLWSRSCEAASFPSPPTGSLLQTCAQWLMRLSRRPPTATWIMASGTSRRVS